MMGNVGTNVGDFHPADGSDGHYRRKQLQTASLRHHVERQRRNFNGIMQRIRHQMRTSVLIQEVCTVVLLSLLLPLRRVVTE